MMHAKTDKVEKEVDNLLQRIGLTSASIETVVADQDHIVDLPDIDGLICRLNRDFPGDVGVLCPLVLNCIHLAPGQSFFMAADEPHAYISGDCVECMAPSDNVVRSGLTPKFKDVDVLCDMLTYR